jgi:ppGpp synthetase/RelA/SpoT-type nucleotidyltranferase
MLKAAGIRAIVSYRAKELGRLREKLERRVRQRGAPFRSDDEIRREVRDLAGVRIALYFPWDRERLEALIRENFQLTERTPKQFPKDSA